jgi:F-type H+-transporting ATPase subunit b
LYALLARITLLAQEEEVAHTNEKEDLYPHLNELIVGAIAFAVLFFFVWKWVLPRVNKLLEERGQKIQGSLEEAEKAKQEADRMLARYEAQLREARGEANRIIEEARKTADSMRKDLLGRAEEESRQLVARAQEEIRAERDRAFEELRASIGELSVELASRVVGETLTKDRHLKLVDSYISELAKKGNGKRGS